MEKIKQYVVFTVLGCLGIMAAGWFLLVSPKRSEAAELRLQAATQVSENAQLATALQVLKAQAKDLPKQQAKLAAVAAKIPDNPALPALIRALTAASSSAGVELVSVSPGPPELTTAAGATAAQPAAARPAAGGALAGQLARIPITLNVVGGYFQVEQFVANLENLPRSMRITNLTLAPGANPMKPAASGPVDDGKSLNTVVSGQVFLAANRPAATAASVPNQAATGVAAPQTVVAPAAPAKK